MTSNNMDINEAFRPEDLSKTDFFDFVTASDIGLDIGVNENNSHNSGSNNVTNQNDSNQTLEGYSQFWNSEKPDRLETEIFEDIDRFCWQQHQQNNHMLVGTTTNISSSVNTSTTNNIINRLQETVNLKVQNNVDNCKNSNNNKELVCPSADENLSSSNINMDLNASDSHVYTLTVLNGNESWLKRSDTIITDAHLAPCLDLDSLLGTFPSYVKSEFVYEDSGFCPVDSSPNTNTSCKTTSCDKNSLSTVVERVSINSENIESTKLNNDTLSTSKLIDNIPAASIRTVSDHINIDELQNNNNNDWHMTDNNSITQNSAESLLRSALQGKGYLKGSHLQNGISLMSVNPVKEDLRGVLFSDETDSSPFADSTLNNSIFEENHSQSILTTATNNNGNIINQNNEQRLANHSSSSTGIIVDDMFLSLDSAFTEDFERIKKIASEVQNFVTGNDYSTEIIMEVAAAAAAAAAGVPTCDNAGDSSLRSGSAIQIIHQPLLQPRTQNSQQAIQPDIITNNKATITSIKPPTKKYKRNSSINSNNNSINCNDNNINTNIISPKGNINNAHIINNNKHGDNLNPNNSTLNSRTSPIHCNGQRKERSLHYCSICSKGFKDKYSVNVHIRTHTGEKPFACTLCGKSFRQKAHLAKHYQTHLAQKSNSGMVKNSKNSNNSRGTSSQSQNNNINSPSIINSLGSLRKARQLSPISNISDVNSGISLSETENNNISNSLTMNNVPLTNLSPATVILANR